MAFEWQTAEPEFSYSTLFFPLLLIHMLITFSNEKWKTYSVELSVHKGLFSTYCMVGASLVAQRIKHLPAMQETRVQSLGWEDPLEKEMAIHSSILAWRIPWREEPGGLQSTGSQRVGHD